jgi:hypothetical protein
MKPLFNASLRYFTERSLALERSWLNYRHIERINCHDKVADPATTSYNLAPLIRQNRHFIKPSTKHFKPGAA